MVFIIDCPKLFELARVDTSFSGSHMVPIVAGAQDSAQKVTFLNL